MATATGLALAKTLGLAYEGSGADTRARLLQLGFEAAGGGVQELTEFGRAERAKWSGVIKAANIKAE